MLLMIPLNEEEETKIKINGKSCTVLVGSSIKQQIPRSKENISVAEVSNQIQRAPVSKPVRITLGPFSGNHISFRVTDTAPVNLLG